MSSYPGDEQYAMRQPSRATPDAERSTTPCQECERAKDDPAEQRAERYAMEAGDLTQRLIAAEAALADMEKRATTAEGALAVSQRIAETLDKGVARLTRVQAEQRWKDYHAGFRYGCDYKEPPCGPPGIPSTPAEAFADYLAQPPAEVRKP